MPLPKPNSDEKEKEFIARCLKDPNVIGEFKEGQRAAVCFSIWENRTN